MTPTRQGSIRLFRFAGIDVYLHWMWFVVAAFEVSKNVSGYTSLLWNVLEYLSLFFIVLLHEFGHSLACRQVGGTANQIVLWPLGGVAYVSPPQRPGAMLWSLAAGPLVNVVLFPVLSLLWMLGHAAGWATTLPNVYALVRGVWAVNLLLLVFNLLPIYPLDGGQILRSLLWFMVGRARSLMAAVVVGFVGVAGLVVFAVASRDAWLGILCVFIVLTCWQGLLQARGMIRLAKAPRHEGFACPSCHTPPPQGPFWVCGQCRQAFDTFETQAVCPKCATQFSVTRCYECGESNPLSAWATTVSVPPRLCPQRVGASLQPGNRFRNSAADHWPGATGTSR